jgi:hypothetical protein
MEEEWFKIKYNYCVGTYQLSDEPELIHIIKTGEVFANKYLVVYDDAWEINTGKTEILTKSQIFNKFKIKL